MLHINSQNTRKENKRKLSFKYISELNFKTYFLLNVRAIAATICILICISHRRGKLSME